MIYDVECVRADIGLKTYQMPQLSRSCPSKSFETVSVEHHGGINETFVIKH